MKNLLSTFLLIIASAQLYAQTDGISYQAVIIDPKIQELPGVDVSGNVFPNRRVAMRFTIYDHNNREEYQEIHLVATDKFGMVNLMIGRGEPTNLGTGDFTLISWGGMSKNLEVEINFDGVASDFVDMSRQELTFVPYAFHRDIRATGDLVADGTTDLNGELVVQGPANLNSSLNVNNDNATVLTGTLSVGGNTDLGAKLDVLGPTNLNDSVHILNQRPTFFSGDLTVAAEGTATFNGATIFNSPANFEQINVNGPSGLNGQVTIRANMDTVGGESNYMAYPLLVEGSKQGIAIKVNETRSTDNNYISFWDNDQMWGRIEGITRDEQVDDPEYKVERAIRITDVTVNVVEAAIAALESGQAVVKLTAAGTSSTACAGLGACVTAPIPSLIAEGSSNLILKIANAVTVGTNVGLAVAELSSFEAFSAANIGVSYQSGAGDYAEWLPKENETDTFQPGELVGVNNGVVTKNAWTAEKVMVVSTRPIVLGNMPDEGQEEGYVKIAFMGQVPVRVIGSVKPGDYVLPSEFSNGFAKAVDPKDMVTRDYKKVCGVVWSVTGKISSGISMVNCAVGLNTNDLSAVVARQEEEISKLKAGHAALQDEMNQTHHILSQLVPGYEESQGLKSNFVPAQTPSTALNNTHNHPIKEVGDDEVVYFEIAREHIESAFDMAREQYTNLYKDQEMNNMIMGKNNLKKIKAKSLTQTQAATSSSQINEVSEVNDLIIMDIKKHPFWQKIDSDPEYKEEIIEYVMSKLEKAYHTHEKHAHHFSHMQRKD